MRKELPIVSTLVVAAFALESCNSFQTINAKAAPLEPKTPIPQPGVEVATMHKVTLPAPYATPIVISQEIPSTPVLPFIYLSQSTLIGERTTDKSKRNSAEISDVGCGMLVGAMATRSDYQTYLKYFMNYFSSIGKWGPARLTQNGTDVMDHMAVLTYLGYRPEELSVEGSTFAGIKARIAEETAKGNPVWINAPFFHKGHHSMAVGVTDEGIIFYDPLYGKGVVIPDNKIQATDWKGEIIWKVFVIKPPVNP